MHQIIDFLIRKKISLSPLAGISDRPFRLISRRFGCPYAFTEMLDARAVLSQRESTKRMMSTHEEDTPLGVQLLGDNIEDIVHAAKVCEDKGFDMLNINAACPVPKIKKKGKGVALMNEPLKIGSMIRSLVQETGLPVALKIRSGFNNDALNYMEVGHIAQEEGVSAIFIHPRHAESKYSGNLSKNHIIEMKDNLRVPIFASGNVLEAQDVLDMMNDTGCDGVSIARGAIGNPWIFAQSIDLLEGRKPRPNPSFEEIKILVKEHFYMMSELYSFERALPRMYKFLLLYFKEYSKLEERMAVFRSTVKTEHDFEQFIENL
ncbi:hypothetical protein AB834_02045 [PVC group bacterium (ex Bugula neritina AB1)]|nr:hypothetical protein AB834_02045 [PVC group bacterium (ex Bugula neritina AB1)]